MWSGVSSSAAPGIRRRVVPQGDEEPADLHDPDRPGRGREDAPYAPRATTSQTRAVVSIQWAGRRGQQSIVVADQHVEVLADQQRGGQVDGVQRPRQRAGQSTRRLDHRAGDLEQIEPGKEEVDAR